LQDFLEEKVKKVCEELADNSPICHTAEQPSETDTTRSANIWRWVNLTQSPGKGKEKDWGCKSETITEVCPNPKIYKYGNCLQTYPSIFAHEWLMLVDLPHITTCASTSSLQGSVDKSPSWHT
jgi:hypothetical protein